MSEAPARLHLRAPAKVNFVLEVLGRRPDGYHELRMLLAPVSLFDDLVVERLEEPGRVEVESEGSALVESGEGNLCARAAHFYLSEAGIDAGVKVRLLKRIPVGAGLGGGSSDAACTILGLEALFGVSLSDRARREAAFRVGADVPFFFARAAAWAEGIGEVITAVPELPRLWMVLVHPGVFLSTGAVYSRFSKGLTSLGSPPTIRHFDFPGVVAGLRNDLEHAALDLEPAVGEVLQTLVSCGAQGALMSGSGSAAFGLFPNEERAQEAVSFVGRHPRAAGWRIEVVHTLAPGSFPFCVDQPDWGVGKR